MENYINIKGKKIKLTEEQVEQIKASLGVESVRLADIKEGDTFKVRTHEFVVLEHSGDTTAVILKDILIHDQEFGKTNKYDCSYVDGACIKFAGEIAAIVGTENLVEHTVDLTSDDGLKDYGEVKRRMSLITTEQYRRYVEILDKHKPDERWWLATPHSTKRHENESWVKCVAPSGFISNFNYGGDGGVRPFCILKSNIFVSN